MFKKSNVPADNYRIVMKNDSQETNGKLEWDIIQPIVEKTHIIISISEDGLSANLYQNGLFMLNSNFISQASTLSRNADQDFYGLTDVTPLAELCVWL